MQPGIFISIQLLSCVTINLCLILNKQYSRNHGQKFMLLLFLSRCLGPKDKDFRYVGISDFS